MVVTCKDIYVSDIGTAGYTEFDVKPEIVSYMCEKPELLDCFMALIHSHNTMSAFFSNTDTQTLREEGTDRAHFVSLIVNNAGSYVAKITRKITESLRGDIVKSYPTWGGERVELSSTPATIDSEYLESYTMDIIIQEDRTLENQVSERYQAIMAEKRAHPTPAYQGYGGTVTYNIWRNQGYANNEEKEQTLFPSISKSGIVCKKEFLQETIYQLVTGSIASTGKSNKNNVPSSKEWVEKHMATIFDRRFSQDIEKFKIWMVPYLEFLLYENDQSCFETNVTSYTDDVIAAAVAEELLKVLRTFKTNKYLETIIVELETYVYIQEEVDSDVEEGGGEDWENNYTGE